MIKFENVEVYNLARAIYSARNPLNSWHKSDTDIYNNAIGYCDLKLVQKLIKAGSDHRKFMRQIFVTVDITAPRMWWIEMDTYKVGTVSNSCSTMHTIHKKGFELSDFSLDATIQTGKKPEQKLIPIVAETEIWKEVKSIPNLKVSNTGRVKTIPYTYQTSAGRVLHYVEKEIKAFVNGKQVVVTVHRNGKTYRGKLDRLMAEAFIPRLVGESRVNHKDGNKLNNNLSNLEWVPPGERKTPLEYMLDTIENLNELRELYIETENPAYWRMMIEKLPQSYNQRRTITLNYENLRNIYFSRRNHKLTEWSVGFMGFIDTLPYANELIKIQHEV